MVESGMKSDAATTAIRTALGEDHDLEHPQFQTVSDAASGVIFS